MNQKEVTILGQSYLLSCPDGGESAFYEAVAQVDREMSAIRDAGKIKARERIAVLAALNLAYQLASRPPAAANAAGGEHQASGDTAVDVDQLVQRIDQRLSADGQLI